MSLYVIDDHPLMREAVVMLLRRLRPGACGSLSKHRLRQPQPDQACAAGTLAVGRIHDARSLESGRWPQTADLG